MKRIISVAICLLMLLPCCIPFASAKKEKETAEKVTEIIMEDIVIIISQSTKMVLIIR